MLRKVLRAKIHRATVTRTDLDYAGSLTLDQRLLDAAGISPNEAVLVADINNGTRHETYIIPGEPGSGVVCVNGAAARLVNVGDLILVLAFDYLTADELKSHKPTIVLVDQNNAITKTL